MIGYEIHYSYFFALNFYKNKNRKLLCCCRALCFRNSDVSQTCLPLFIVFGFFLPVGLEYLYFKANEFTKVYPGNSSTLTLLGIGRICRLRSLFISGKFSWVLILNIGCIPFFFNQYYECYSHFLFSNSITFSSTCFFFLASLSLFFFFGAD